MGWNSWNYFACNINEEVIKKTADILVDSGLAALGYNYVNIDDCWQTERDDNGKIVPDPVAFPSGMKALADYVHSKGLKFGLYSDAGHQTCAGRPGSHGYEDNDAQSYAEWGVDYLKYDNCFNDGTSPKVRYPKMRDALLKSGRDIFFSMCEWGVEDPAKWATPVGNSWRTTQDISDNWDSFLEILDLQYGLEKYSGPGGWNDPDMLEVGNGGMTDREYEAHFSLWALLKAPLLIGCDLTNMSEATRRLLGNTELIAINQDPLGKQGRRIQRNERPTGYIEVYAGEVVDGIVIVLFNRTKRIEQISANFRDAGWKLEGGFVKDLISKHDYGYVVNSFTIDVKPHGAIVLKLTECKECHRASVKFLQ
jgi:alpha-galactosidase